MKRVTQFVMYVTGLFALASGVMILVQGRTGCDRPLKIRPDPYTFATPLEPGVERKFSVVLYNGNPKPVRLIGGAQYCAALGCATIEGLPVTIEPGAESTLEGYFLPGGEGILNYEGPIYTDCPSFPIVTLKLNGTILKSADDRSN